MAPSNRLLFQFLRGSLDKIRSSKKAAVSITQESYTTLHYSQSSFSSLGPPQLTPAAFHGLQANQLQKNSICDLALSGQAACRRICSVNVDSRQLPARQTLAGCLVRLAALENGPSSTVSSPPWSVTASRAVHQQLRPCEPLDRSDCPHSAAQPPLPSTKLSQPLRNAESSALRERAAADTLKTAAKDGGPLNVDDAQALFSQLTTGELARALLNLEIAANELLVDVGTAVLRSPLMKSKLVSAPLLAAVKSTAYAHFCAGETVDEAAQTLQRMWQLGLRGILDFSVEDAHDGETCDRNLEGFLRTIGQATVLPEGSVSFACVKLSALCPLRTLERASEILRWRHLAPDCPAPWLLPSLPVLAPESPRYHVKEAPAPLNSDEARDIADAYRRLTAICVECQEQGLPLLVDAEYTSVEPVIDHLAYAAAVEFNRGGPPLVYATVQCYCKDAMPRLAGALRAAQDKGIAYGVKLVRGAYLTRETKLAEELDAESPLHGSIEETHRCYDACAAMMLEAAARCGPSNAAVVLATHNYGSGRAAVLKAAELGLRKDAPQLHFAQLKGMADGLSLGLSLAGYPVSKYLPYGPVAEVMPYLLRRAEENRGVLGNTGPERRRLRSELGRRFRAAVSLA